VGIGLALALGLADGSPPLTAGSTEDARQPQIAVQPGAGQSAQGESCGGEPVQQRSPQSWHAAGAAEAETSHTVQHFRLLYPTGYGSESKAISGEVRIALAFVGAA
jgi:hypothetical protein